MDNDVIVQFKEWTGKIEKGRYGDGSIALKLVDTNDGSQIAIATVSVPNRYPPEGHVFVKNWSENEGMVAALESAGVVHDTGIRVKTGFVEAHLCQLLK